MAWKSFEITSANWFREALYIHHSYPLIRPHPGYLISHSSPPALNTNLPFFRLIFFGGFGQPPFGEDATNNSIGEWRLDPTSVRLLAESSVS